MYALACLVHALSLLHLAYQLSKIYKYATLVADLGFFGFKVLHVACRGVTLLVSSLYRCWVEAYRLSGGHSQVFVKRTVAQYDSLLQTGPHTAA